MYQVFQRDQLRRFSVVCLLVLSLLISLAPAVLAAPASTASENESDYGFVDVRANVPDDFAGIVYVMLSSLETGEYHTIYCDELSDYVSTGELPCGEYIVENVYTSEDTFLYEAFTETDTFILEPGVFVLDVDVQAKSDGENTLNSDLLAPIVDSSASGEIETEDMSGTPQEEPVPSDTEDTSSDQSENTSQDTSNFDSSLEETPDPESENPWFNVLRQVVNVLFGTAVFVAIVFGVVYFVRKRR